MKRPNIEQRFMDVHDTARYLGMSEDALRYKLEARRLPFVKIGKTIRFDRTKLDAFLEQNTIEPIQPRRAR